MESYWECSDCGTLIPYARLDAVKKERKEKGVAVMPYFNACKGTDNHISAVKFKPKEKEKKC